MASRRVSLKGKGAELFFGGESSTDGAEQPSEENTKQVTRTVVPEDQSIDEVRAVATPTPPTSGSAPPMQPTRQSRYRDTTVPRYQDTTIEAIRKVVRAPGKEAATYRLSQDEKTAVADIIYTYKRQGVRTSEIEISRIALNFILGDYEENGDESVLARALKALHE